MTSFRSCFPLLLLVCVAAPARAQNDSTQTVWAAQNSATTIHVGWNAVSGAKGYRFLTALNKGQPKLTATAAPNSLFWVVMIPAGSVGQQRQFFVEPVLADGSFGPAAASNIVVIRDATELPVPPAAVKASVTADAVMVTWPDVPGATAYSIGRNVAPNGFRVVCQYCPTTASYIDHAITMGTTHTYGVAAVFPAGPSKRTMSNTVTPGVVADTTTTKPPSAITAALALLSPADRKPTSVNATITSGTSVRVTWTPPPNSTTWVKSYVVMRRINGQFSMNHVGTLQSTELEVTDRFFPSTMFAQGPVRVKYEVSALGDGERYSPLAPKTESNEVQMTAATATSGAGTAAGSSGGQPCTLEYQRADNMWAATGRPDGNLGTETLSLASGQSRVFITDWTYEKQRNDGSSYFGSHLRVARNPAAGVLRLRIKPGLSSTWIKLDPTKSMDFRADLMEVFCE